MKCHSSIASNRTTFKVTNNERILIPVRYLETNFVESYKNFQHNDEMSLSTFCKYTKLNGEYKKPFRLTDLCGYCEWYNKTMHKIQKIIKNSPEFIVGDCLDPKKLIKFLVSKKRSETDLDNTVAIEKNILLVEQFGIIYEHRRIKNIQRESYNKDISSIDILEGKILIEIDFKQKIKIGMSGRQVNEEYYNQEQRSCLGDQILSYLYSEFISI